MSPVAIAATELKLTITTPANRGELIKAVEDAHADLGLLLAYGRILPPAVLSACPQGILNLHPSLLPKYRGAAPVFWPIWEGETETGVSLIQLDDGCDTGPLLAKKPQRILPDDTTGRLTDRLVDEGIALLAEILPDYLAGTLSPQPQTGIPSLTRKVTVDDGLIDWKQPARQIERQIRACQPWPRARTTWRGQPLLILGAAVKGKMCIPTLVHPAGRREMTWADFCRGQHLDENQALDELTRSS